MTGQHSGVLGPGRAQTEPAAVAEAARLILGALVATGWITIPDATVNAVVTLVGALASVGLTIWTRRRVSPVARPQINGDGPAPSGGSDATGYPTPPV